MTELHDKKPSARSMCYQMLVLVPLYTVGAGLSFASAILPEGVSIEGRLYGLLVTTVGIWMAYGIISDFRRFWEKP